MKMMKQSEFFILMMCVYLHLSLFIIDFIRQIDMLKIWKVLLKLVNLLTVCFLLLCISYEDQSHGGPLSMLVLR